MYASSLSTSAKPSWAFDVADGFPRSKTTIQNYRIPYPSAPDEEAAEGQQFVCARAFLVFINILFFVVGFAAIVTSIAVSAKPERCEVCHSVLNLLLTFGLVTTFISALGIYGALSNSYKILLVYVTFVAFVFMVQMVVFFWPLFGRFNFKRRMHTVFREKMRYHPQQLTEVLNLLQRRLPCCGVDGPRDYHSAGLQLPLSCCSSTDGSQCAVRTRPTASTTPLPASNATEQTANATSSLASVTSTVTAPAAMGLMRQELSEEEATTPEEAVTHSNVDDTTTEAEEMFTQVGNASSQAGGRTSEARQTPTSVEGAHTEKAANATDKIAKIETKTGRNNASSKAEEKPQEELLINAAKTTTEAGSFSNDEYDWNEIERGPGIEREEPEAEEPDLDVSDVMPKDRRKRSAAVGVSRPPEPVTAALDGVTPGNASMIVYNSSAVLTGNLSLNGTEQIIVEELLGNRTNLTGGPEPWDIRHVKMAGCYGELWRVAEQQHGLTVAVTVAAVAVLSLQLVVLCTAHHVARGDFIQHG